MQVRCLLLLLRRLGSGEGATAAIHPFLAPPNPYLTPPSMRNSFDGRYRRLQIDPDIPCSILSTRRLMNFVGPILLATCIYVGKLVDNGHLPRSVRYNGTLPLSSIPLNEQGKPEEEGKEFVTVKNSCPITETLCCMNCYGISHFLFLYLWHGAEITFCPKCCGKRCVWKKQKPTAWMRAGRIGGYSGLGAILYFLFETPHAGHGKYKPAPDGGDSLVPWLFLTIQSQLFCYGYAFGIPLIGHEIERSIKKRHEENDWSLGDSLKSMRTRFRQGHRHVPVVLLTMKAVVAWFSFQLGEYPTA